MPQVLSHVQVSGAAWLPGSDASAVSPFPGSAHRDASTSDTVSSLQVCMCYQIKKGCRLLAAGKEKIAGAPPTHMINLPGKL